jgi:hypothetical protein
MLPVSLVHTDGSLSWPHRLKAISSVEIRIGPAWTEVWVFLGGFLSPGRPIAGFAAGTVLFPLGP